MRVLPIQQKMPKIQVLSSALRTQINQRFRNYDDITLVCHSLGGVIARQYILEEIKAGDPLRVSGLVLFAVPNNGAELAHIGNVISLDHEQLKQLVAESDFLDILNTDWVTMKASAKLRMKYVAGMQDRVVERKSAQLYVGNRDLDTVNRGHSDIVKPKNADDDAVLILTNFLLDNPARITDVDVQLKKDVSDGAQRAGISAAELHLSLNRNASENYWYTYDGDDNRNIFQHDRRRRWSISIFHAMPRIISTFDVTVHAVEAAAYNGHLAQWQSLEDRVQIGFPGPNVQKAAMAFQEQNPPFASTTIRAKESKMLNIAKIGIFSASLSAEFTFRSSLWGASDDTCYACVYFVLHVNTHYLFFTCLLPEMSSYPAPAYFLGEPHILDVNNKTRFLELAAGPTISIQSLSRHERLLISGIIG
jgi:pimeloyl-ACP methyl ester carboxylesterase